MRFSDFFKEHLETQMQNQILGKILQEKAFAIACI